MKLNVKLVTLDEFVRRASSSKDAPTTGQFQVEREKVLSERNIGDPVSVQRCDFNSHPPQFSVE